MNRLEGALLVWEHTLGSYRLSCTIEDDSSGSTRVRVIENGRPIDERVLVNDPKEADDWRLPLAVARELNYAYLPHAMMRMTSVLRSLRFDQRQSAELKNVS